MRAHVTPGHLPRIAVALSVVAIALWATGLQAADAVSVVKRALSAKNADAVDRLSASKKPRPGRLLALGANGKFPSAVIPAQARGPRGAQGPSGAAGTDGARGPSDGYVDSAPAQRALSTQPNVAVTVARLAGLPAGSYMLASIVQAADFTNGGEIVTCVVKANGAVVAGSASVIGAGAGSSRAAVLSTTAAVTRADAFEATLDCHSDSTLAAPPSVSDARLTAIRVASLRSTP